MYPGKISQEHPDKPAVITEPDGVTLTYRQLNERSLALARALRFHGILSKDNIAILMENSGNFYSVCWAAQRSGLYYTAISTRLKAEEIGYILKDCGAKYLFVSPQYRELAFDSKLISQTNVEIITIDPHDESQDFRVFTSSQVESLDECEGSDLLYSSGTTGKPKGVKLPITLAPIGSNSAIQLLMAGIYGANENSIYLSPAPSYHAAPLRFSMAMLRIGGTVITLKKFEPDHFLSLIEKHQVTHTQVVPTMFVRLLKIDPDIRNKYNLSSLQCLIHAAAPCPVEVKEEIINWFGPIIYEYYAGTEGNGFVCINSEEWMKHKGSVGRALLGKIHILDEQGNELGPHSDGLVFFEGATHFEYLNDPGKTSSSRNSKGWSTLGDVGHLDEEGYLYLTDRKAYMIISGGVNIYPQEVENVLITHPKVSDAAVFGIPNEEFGEEVKAVVQPVDFNDAGKDLEETLIDFCKSKLANYKCPKSIDFMEELPREPTGKLLKRILKDKYWQIPSNKAT